MSAWYGRCLYSRRNEFNQVKSFDILELNTNTAYRLVMRMYWRLRFQKFCYDLSPFNPSDLEHFASAGLELN